MEVVPAYLPIYLLLFLYVYFLVYLLTSFSLNQVITLHIAYFRT